MHVGQQWKPDYFNMRCAQIKEQKKKCSSKMTVTSMKWTNKGDIDCWVQLLSSFPPSLMFDPVDVKAGDLTKEPVFHGRKHRVILLSFFFLEEPLSTLLLASIMPLLK